MYMYIDVNKLKGLLKIQLHVSIFNFCFYSYNYNYNSIVILYLNVIFISKVKIIATDFVIID
jgi:hypothetical protein